MATKTGKRRSTTASESGRACTAMSREARATYGEIQAGVKSLEKATAEMPPRLGRDFTRQRSALRALISGEELTMTKSTCRRIAACALLLVLILVSGAAPGAAHAARARRYVLTAGSQFQSGCFPPCLCPLTLEQPVRGRFFLVRTGSQDGELFETFAVRGVRWIVGDGSPDGKQTVRGSGTYRVGGEVALTQRLELDLSLDGAPPQHFDSGDVSADVPFPEIAATISMNGMVCFDNVFTIDAVPRGRPRARR
jgi:hypothetical protein